MRATDKCAYTPPHCATSAHGEAAARIRSDTPHRVSSYYLIVIPTLNRYEHFKECVESLAACVHAEKTELIIGLDYPPAEKYIEGWKKIKDYIPTIAGFAKVSVFARERNYGLGIGGNLACLTAYAFAHYDACILTEDDNVFSPCFLDYMDKALEKYRGDKNVYAVSGYMHPVKWSKATSANVVYMYDYMAWGIGIYKDRREASEKSMPPHYMKYVCSHKELLSKLKNYPRDLYQLVFWTRSNPKLDCRCDFTLAVHNIINGLHIVNPLLSLVQNRGYDGSGENCGRLTNDIFSGQVYSQEKTFDIRDTLTAEEQTAFMHEWQEWRSHNAADEFSKMMYRKAMSTYWMFMHLGYSITMIILNILDFIHKILSLPYRLVKRMVKQI